MGVLIHHKIGCLDLVVLIVLVGLILSTFVDHRPNGGGSGGGVVVVYCDIQTQSCEGSDMRGLVEKCSSYVMKLLVPRPPPSAACCDIVKKVDEACVCSHVTKEVEALISMDKAVFVADYCGRPLPSGTQCGSYTVPGA